MVRQHDPQSRKITHKTRSSISLALRSPRNHTAPKQKTQSPPVQLRSLRAHAYTSPSSDKLPITGRPTAYDMLHGPHDLDDDNGDLHLDGQYHSDDDPNWDEETTLIALLDDHNQPGHEDKTIIVDRLGPAFASRRQAGNEHIKQTLIPVIQRTKQVHDIIDEDILIRRLQGLAVFDENARRLEDATRCEYDAKSIDALFVNLEDLIKESDNIFQEYKARMDKYVNRLRQCADQVPGDVERMISKLDKKAKHLGAEDHAQAKEKLLRGILEKY
ncbi:hypothetical protein BU15DRAFT_70526 [Melanogaster broomeanus]|nr:hypothetical protein BU15DRAFT_70526 [Melanogaster broomeanus]